MPSKIPDCLTEQHLILFATLVQSFAHHEYLIEQIMSSISGADPTSIKIITSGFRFAEKRDALIRLLRHRAIPLDQIDEIENYLETLCGHIQLHNDISHSLWVSGTPENLTKPAWLTHGSLHAIKAQHDTGTTKNDFVEYYDDKVTYTIEQLQEINAILAENYSNFKAFLLVKNIIGFSKK